ncbi:hypothetical protein Tco_1272092, partial [Tanacetum coccineum]
FDNDDDLFEMDSNNDEWKRILYGEDFERMDSDSDKTKDFDKSSSNVFKSLSDEFEPGGSSYVEGNDLVCYKDFDLENFQVEPKNDILNPKVLVFDPGFPDFGGFMVQDCGRTKQCPQFLFDGIQSSLHNVGNLLSLSLSN